MFSSNFGASFLGFSALISSCEFCGLSFCWILLGFSNIILFRFFLPCFQRFKISEFASSELALLRICMRSACQSDFAAIFPMLSAFPTFSFDAFALATAPPASAFCSFCKIFERSIISPLLSIKISLILLLGISTDFAAISFGAFASTNTLSAFQSC